MPSKRTATALCEIRRLPGTQFQRQAAAPRACDLARPFCGFNDLRLPPKDLRPITEHHWCHRFLTKDGLFCQRCQYRKKYVRCRSGIPLLDPRADLRLKSFV